MKTPVRMPRYAACLAAICSIAIATPSVSSDFANQETYRCNTRNGEFDGTVFPFSSTGTIISGELSLHAADIGPRWLSLGKILAHQRGSHYSDDDCGCNGIVVYARKNPDHIEFDMTANGTDVPMAQSPYDTPITFRISFGPHGAMTVAIGKTNPVTKTATLLHPEHDTLELSCSGADISFLDIAAL